VADGKLTQVRRSFKLKEKKAKRSKKPAKKTKAVTFNIPDVKKATKEEASESVKAKRKINNVSRQKLQRLKQVLSSRSKSKVISSAETTEKQTTPITTVAQVTEEQSTLLKVFTDVE
jgi:hypothetical protein